MNVNDNDVQNGNVICDGGKIFEMRHQMACAILGICKIHFERDREKWNSETGRKHYIQMHCQHIHLFFQENASNSSVSHACIHGLTLKLFIFNRIWWWQELSWLIKKLFTSRFIFIKVSVNIYHKISISSLEFAEEEIFSSNEALRMERKWKNDWKDGNRCRLAWFYFMLA